jgi:hypothetical protein
MNLITHIAMAKMLYSNLNSIMDLDKKAFVYGNIKPDMTYKLLRNPHTLENYFLTVCSSAEKLMNDNKLSLKEFSIELGVICHYVCDFFCQYHLKDELFHRFREHFIYELKLHAVLLLNYSGNEKLKIESINQNIAVIIRELRKDYSAIPASMKKDLKYALTASMSICESVYYLSDNYIKSTEKQEPDASYLSLPIAGGQ